MESESDMAQSIINEFFIKTEKGYVHKKCEDMLKEYRKTSKKNKANGSKGGRPKKTEGCETTQDKPTGLPNGNDSVKSGNLNYKPITINQELETNNNNTNTNTSANADSAPKEKPELKKQTRFKPPEIQETTNYFLSSESSALEAEKYFAYYSSNGWMVGKSKMKSWKHAAKGWILRNGANSNLSSGGGPTNGRRQSLAERAEQQTREILAGCEAEEVSYGHVGQDDAALRSQVGLSSGGQDREVSPNGKAAIDGEFSLVVSQDGENRR